MTAKERILTALAASPKGLCDTCLEAAAGIPRHQHVNNVCHALRAQGAIVRDEGENRDCPGCGKSNIVNRAV